MATAKQNGGGGGALATTDDEPNVALEKIRRTCLGKMQTYVQRLAGPQHSERLTQAFLNAFERNPQLLECTPVSIMRALLYCAEVGLEPGLSNSRVYLIPRNCRVKHAEGKADSWERQCTVMTGVWGYVELAARDGARIWAEVVRKNDRFAYSAGSGEPTIEHLPDVFASEAERGPIVGAYACARLADGSIAVAVMGLAELEQARKAGDGKSGGPWDTWFSEMCKKTVIKRLCKGLPSRRAQIAASLDDGEPVPTLIDAEGEAAGLLEEAAPSPSTAGTNSLGALVGAS
jgi:recombination protein RecT